MKQQQFRLIPTAVLLAALASGAAMAETTFEDWNASYNGPASAGEAIEAIAVDGFGNVFATGALAQWKSGYLYGTWGTLKYSPSGLRRWATTYSGPSGNSDQPASVAVDERGNSYVTGYSFDGGCRTAKYDPDGVEQWAASAPGQCHAAAIDEDGNLYVAGRNGQQDMLLIKYSPAGVQQWARVYTGPGGNWDISYQLKIGLDGFPVVAGTSERADFARSFVVAKYDDLGNQMWLQRIDTVRAWLPPAMAMDNDDNVIIAGGVSATGGYNVFVAKFAANGQPLWQKEWNGPAGKSDSAEAVTVDAAGDVVVAGFSDGGSSYLSAKMTTVKFSGVNGNVKWVNATGGGSIATTGRGMGITSDSTGNVYVVGGVANDGRVIKYSMSGTTIWDAPYSGAFLTKVALDAKGCVIAAGERNDDFFVVKLCQEGGLICN